MKPRWLALVVGLQVAWLLATAFTAERSLASGRVIRLETVPVDPRDLLRGDYVILAYPFSRIRLDQFEPVLTGGELPAPGTAVYVQLALAGEFHQLVRATLEPPETPADTVVLRGHTTGPGGGPALTDGELRVEYGLERFYVREGTGEPQGKLTVDVSVDESGLGMIREVYLDGVRYADAMRVHAK